MEEEAKFCKNCKRNVAAVNFVIHIAHCARKIWLCQLCDEPVPRSEIDDHLKECHTLENCTFCGLPIEKWKLDSHQRDQCYKRLVNCKYCDLSQTFDNISEHEVSCGSQIDKCSSCNICFLLKEKEAHLEVCQKENHRQFFCEYCDQKFSWKEFQSHPSHCRARFKICCQCGEPVDVSELDHHLGICQKGRRRESKRACQYCGKNFPSNILMNHESSCEFRLEKCPHCYEFVKYKAMEIHQEVCDQIRRRELECTCQHCEKNFPSSALESHESSCGFRPEKCPNCSVLVSFKDMKKHNQNCEQIRKKESESSCGKNFPSSIIENHERNCGFSREKRQNSSDYVPYIEEHKEHMKEQKEVCSEESDSDDDLVSCEYCKEKCPPNSLTLHMNHCPELEEKYRSCDALVKIKDKYNHKEICVESHSDERSVSCEYCKEKFPLNSLALHMNRCPEFVEKCRSCDALVKMKDKYNHKEICVLTDHYAQQSLHPNLSSLKSRDTHERSSKERLYDTYLKADIDPDLLKNPIYNQSSEPNAKNDKPMEIDDNNIVEKHKSNAIDLDSDLDSCIQFLKNDRDKLPGVCRTCENECVCKIEKSLSTVGEFDDKGEVIKESSSPSHGQLEGGRPKKIDVPPQKSYHNFWTDHGTEFIQVTLKEKKESRKSAEELWREQDWLLSQLNNNEYSKTKSLVDDNSVMDQPDNQRKKYQPQLQHWAEF